MAGSLVALRLEGLSVRCIDVGAGVVCTVCAKGFFVYFAVVYRRFVLELLSFFCIFVLLVLAGFLVVETTERAHTYLAVSLTARGGLSTCGCRHFEPLSAPAAAQTNELSMCSCGT